MSSGANYWEARCHLTFTDVPRMSFLFPVALMVRVVLLSAEGNFRHAHILGRQYVVMRGHLEGLEWP